MPQYVLDQRLRRQICFENRTSIQRNHGRSHVADVVKTFDWSRMLHSVTCFLLENREFSSAKRSYWKTCMIFTRNAVYVNWKTMMIGYKLSRKWWHRGRKTICVSRYLIYQPRPQEFLPQVILWWSIGKWHVSRHWCQSFNAFRITNFHVICLET